MKFGLAFLQRNLKIMSKDKTRILYLGTNRVYFNPTLKLFPLAVNSFFEMVYYGPGHQTNEVLKKGVKNFIEHNDSFDLIFTDGVIFFYKNLVPFNASYNYFLPKQNVDYILDMRDFFICSNHKKLLYPNIDFYNVTLDEIELLKSSDTFLLAWGEEFHEYVENCPAIHKESYGHLMNDNWINFIKENGHKVISLPQIIDENEFNFSVLEKRKYDISVPGANYYYRREILKGLKKTKLKLNTNNTGLFQKLMYFLVKRQSRVALKIVNAIFTNTIEDSKIVYTCGGSLNYVVRKFFEIPALGSALFCKPCIGINNLGFVDGETAIFINDLKLANTVFETYLNSPKKLQDIAKKGQKLVFEKHSFTARSKQIHDSIVKILDGSFKGSYWYNGEFYLK